MVTIPLTERAARSAIRRRPTLILLGALYLVAASVARTPLALLGAALVLAFWFIQLVLAVRRGPER